MRNLERRFIFRSAERICAGKSSCKSWSANHAVSHHECKKSIGFVGKSCDVQRKKMVLNVLRIRRPFVSWIGIWSARQKKITRLYSKIISQILLFSRQILCLFPDPLKNTFGEFRCRATASKSVYFFFILPRSVTFKETKIEHEWNIHERRTRTFLHLMMKARLIWGPSHSSQFRTNCRMMRKRKYMYSSTRILLMQGQQFLFSAECAIPHFLLERT